MASKTKTPDKAGEAPTVHVPPQHDAGALAPKSKDAPVANVATDASVADFVAKIKALGPAAGAGCGRLIFAMDATMSRQPTWDMALALQSDMFATVKDVGGLDVQLTFFRGHGECKSSRWVSDPDQLAHLMRRVTCQGGLTQLSRVLSAARDEASAKKVNALVYVGDAMEENIDQVCARAGELALCGVPAFMFQEGHDANASLAFKEVARITRGAYCRFDAGSAKQLRDLLTAVAAYAAGGHRALLALSQSKNSAAAQRLIAQLPPGQK
jgi:hypothetical protein